MSVASLRLQVWGFCLLSIYRVFKPIKRLKKKKHTSYLVHVICLPFLQLPHYSQTCKCKDTDVNPLPSHCIMLNNACTSTLIWEIIACSSKTEPSLHTCKICYHLQARPQVVKTSRILLILSPHIWKLKTHWSESVRLSGSPEAPNKYHTDCTAPLDACTGALLCTLVLVSHHVSWKQQQTDQNLNQNYVKLWCTSCTI